jgi:endonuclease/exonuclease/phosphatase family metal-dependent hydrolase
MLVIHLKAFGDAESAARRALAATMLVEIIENLRRTEGLPVLLGGDFNDALNTSVFKPLQDSPDLFSLTADDASSDAISFVGSSHRSLIDHIVVSRDTELGEISSDDAAIVRLDKSVANFAGTVSDHVPVVVRLILRDKVADVEPGKEEGRSLVAIPEGSKRVGIEFLTD